MEVLTTSVTVGERVDCRRGEVGVSRREDATQTLHHARINVYRFLLDRYGFMGEFTLPGSDGPRPSTKFGSERVSKTSHAGSQISRTDQRLRRGRRNVEGLGVTKSVSVPVFGTQGGESGVIIRDETVGREGRRGFGTMDDSFGLTLTNKNVSGPSVPDLVQ